MQLTGAAVGLYYDRGGITIYHGDCREIAPTFPPATFDALVSDPPWGMDADTDSTRFSGGRNTHRRYKNEGRDWPQVHGDADEFDPAPWLDFPEVILWGSNHFAQRLPVGTTLVWIKKADHLFGTFLSDAEIGWQKGNHGVYCCRKTFPPPTKLRERGGLRPIRRKSRSPLWRGVSGSG